MKKNVLSKAEKAFIDQRLRLEDQVLWFPLPALIAFGLVLLLIGHLLPVVNPRIGSMANIINFKTERQKEGSMWLGIYPKGDQLVITTSDRKRFNFPLEIKEIDQLSKFDSYLKERTKKVALTLSLSKNISLTETTFVLAVDERLKYIHIKPIINLLAKNKITKYGFETQIVKKNSTH
ncbi:MAG: hypothetical protein HQK54_14625 [Oligoflexales bacterium]|nr:hypothetical protein [Oligoflexales bacterium]